MMGFGSYRTAWVMCHRIRAGLANEDFQKLMGIVEVDETFVGGKAKNRHKDRRGDGSGGTGGPINPKWPMAVSLMLFRRHSGHGRTCFRLDPVANDPGCVKTSCII
jgi:hypothetical protein